MNHRPVNEHEFRAAVLTIGTRLGEVLATTNVLGDVKANTAAGMEALASLLGRAAKLADSPLPLVLRAVESAYQRTSSLRMGAKIGPR